jgi:hypothetical protein
MMLLIRRLLPALALAVLSGCAALKTFNSEVSTFGTWPAGRAAGTFAIDRLPSQQANPDAQEPIEQAAQAALMAAGFAPVARGAEPDVLVQLGVRVTAQSRSPWDDPAWWPGGFRRWNWPRWGDPTWGWGWGARWQQTEYAREVALLIRDRASGQPLYEAHASSDGLTPGGQTVLAGLFLSALKEFPAAKPEPHNVGVVLP